MGRDFPDGSKLSIIRGWDGTQFRNIRVADTGEMYILVSALTDDTLIPLQADSLGNLLLNIKAQDLAEVINRPKYGGAQKSESEVSCNYHVWTTLLTLSGKGMIYGGWIQTFWANNPGSSLLRLSIDGVEFCTQAMGLTRFLGNIGAFLLPYFTSIYDTQNEKYQVNFSYGFTFESSLTIEFYNEGASGSPVCKFYYALV